MARKATQEDVRTEIQEFAYELGLRYDGDRQITGTISKDYLPKPRGLLGTLEANKYEPVPRWQYEQLQTRFNQLSSDMRAICQHLGITLAHNQTNVLDLSKLKHGQSSGYGPSDDAAKTTDSPN